MKATQSMTLIAAISSAEAFKSTSLIFHVTILIKMTTFFAVSIYNWNNVWKI